MYKWMGPGEIGDDNERVNQYITCFLVFIRHVACFN